MDRFKLLIGSLRADHHSDEGATIVEYSLLVGLIAMTLIIGFRALETDMAGLFSRVMDTIT
ncbi:Flp family type IVb pilin [Actinoplanes xinjiangensis]|uniref:Flp family type IVb pilin n=1 Tax=Actinoplanes xinjiangensis TaxID=512350 RepID=UPI00343D796A